MANIRLQLQDGFVVDFESLDDFSVFYERFIRGKREATLHSITSSSPNGNHPTGGGLSYEPKDSVKRFIRELDKHADGIRNADLAAALHADRSDLGPMVSGFSRLMKRLGVPKDNALVQRKDAEGRHVMCLTPVAREALRQAKVL